MNEITKITLAIPLMLLLGVSFPVYAEKAVTSEDESEVVQEEADTTELAVDESDANEDDADTEESVDEDDADTEESDVDEADEDESNAEEYDGDEPEEGETPEAAEPELIKGFTIKHQVGETEVPAKTITADLMVLLETLKEDIIAQAAQQTKPFTMKTEISGDWVEDAHESWHKLPPLAITTEVDKEGKGESDVAFPAFKEVDESDKVTLDWKGLQGKLTFAEKFADLKADLTTQGLLIKEEEGDNFTLDVGKATLKGEFDEILIPKALDFNLPSLKISDDESQFAAENIAFKSNVKTVEQEIELSAGHFKVGQLQFTVDKETSTLKDFAINVDLSLEKEGAVFKVDTNIGKLVMPKSLFDDLMDLNLSYVGNLELRHLDPEVIKQLQKTARELEKQQQSGEIPSEMVSLTWFAKLTELAPALLAKSPELALTKLQLKTDDGKLDGKVTVSIEGSKASNLEDFSSLIGALQVQADFSLTKALLQKTMIEVMTNQKMTEENLSQEEALKAAKTFTEKQIKGYVEQKLLKEAGENYELSATFKEGKFTVNGQEMPLPFSADSEELSSP